MFYSAKIRGQVLHAITLKTPGNGTKRIMCFLYLVNPPNCPEHRPVENFRAIMKSKCRKMGGECKTSQNFEVKWKKANKSGVETLVHNLMANVKSKVRQFARKGII